jgi:hypothetical protein
MQVHSVEYRSILGPAQNIPKWVHLYVGFSELFLRKSDDDKMAEIETTLITTFKEREA